MQTWLLSLVSVTMVSLVALVGVLALSLGEVQLRRLSAVLVSFAVGALLGDAFIHLIPDTLARSPGDLRPSLLVLAGILTFFIVEKLLRHRHGPLHHAHHPETRERTELATINIIGDAIHNFIDGAMIGASYLADPTLGVSTTIAVLFHEIPQELGDFGVLVHSGLGVRRAVLLNLASASVAILGTVTALLVGAMAETAVASLLIPITAGGFVYIAVADLIPELQHDRSFTGLLLQVSLIALGIGVMALLALTPGPGR